MGSSSFESDFTLSRDVFRYWIINRSKREIRIVCQDGRELVQEIPDDHETLNSEIEISIFDWENWWIISHTKRGNTVFAEAYSPKTLNPLHGRPSVYLDQNHWSTLARAIFDPASIRRASERLAAKELIFLAQDGGIVLPLSTANIRETAHLYGDKRYEIGASIASLSGGWQIRHPLTIWRGEALQLLAQMHAAEVPTEALRPVITLEPRALLDSETSMPQRDLKDHELFTLALAGPEVILELLINEEKSERIDPELWVTSNESFAALLASSQYPKHQKERIAYSRAWTENRGLIEAAAKQLSIDSHGISSVKAGEIPRLFAKMPALGCFTRLMVMRQINPSHKWRSNDLTDLIFLSCATAYADYVAAEKHTGTQLRQHVQATSQGARVHTNLESLVAQLRADGVKTASEREIVS